MQLVAANRSSRSLAELGRRLALASDPDEVWQALADGLAEALGVACRIAVQDPSGERLFLAPGRDGAAGGVWTVLPAAPGAGIRVEVRLPPRPENGAPSPTGLAAVGELPAILIRHAADTWRRIAMARELEAERLRSDMERLRSALLASVSHDLKSPLAAMMGCAESLQLLDGQLSGEDRRELLDTILRESRRLESYIQNLLDMTRLGHGELRIERDWVPLDEIIGSAVKRLKRYLPETRVDYHSACPGQLLWVHGALVEQAIFNILENAARFSPAGAPVRIDTEVDGGDCVIAVEDRGPGIPAPLREQVFDMFYVVNEGDRRQGGTGMGLAICRGMIAAHGGSVHIEDGRAGGGARLVVRLPLPATGQELAP